ncbi:MAG TPA: hypothetical protein VMZ28_06460 [Kofleriaceae bacterium]|nr:hypothetical protein [Kofleriaceae bacterium]
MRPGHLATIAVLLVSLAGTAEPVGAASLRGKTRVARRSKGTTGQTATTARPRRLKLGGLSLSRKAKSEPAAQAPGAIDQKAPETKKKTASGLVGKVRARWSKMPRAAKIAIAGVAVGGAIAGSWALPAALAVKVGITVGIVALSGVGGLYARARGKIAGWKSSPSYAAIATIEEAAARGDAGRLDQLEGAQRERHAALSSAIASARRLKAERLPDGTRVEDAARELDFTGLAIARSTLHEAARSSDAGRRMGQRTVDSWTRGIGELDAAAQSSDFEGDLALELDALDTELAGEGRAVEGISGTIDAYGKHVPRLFGGDMKAARDSTRGLLEKFVTDEIGRERSLHERTTGAMRGRVTKRLVARDTTFASHHGRLERLSALAEETGEVAALAEDIDSELASAINHRSSEQTYLMIAASKTAVPVTKTRTGANGQTETYTDIEDQSGMYRAMASSEASAAASAGRNARNGLERLRPLLEQLRANDTLRAEELDGHLPAPNNSSVRAGDSGLMSLLGPPVFNLLMGSGSNVRDVRSSFQSDLSRIRQVHGEASSRRQTEHTWVATRVTADLDRQKAEARR